MTTALTTSAVGAKNLEHELDENKERTGRFRRWQFVRTIRCGSVTPVPSLRRDMPWSEKR